MKNYVLASQDNFCDEDELAKNFMRNNHLHTYGESHVVYVCLRSLL